jgi:hypothetical protein
MSAESADALLAKEREKTNELTQMQVRHLSFKQQ